MWRRFHFEFTSTGDDRYLSEMTRCIFQAGFVWRVVDNKWDDFEDVFFGADAHRAPGTGDEFDVAGYGRAQAGDGYRPLVAAADVHDAHGLLEAEPPQRVEPVPGVMPHAASLRAVPSHWSQAPSPAPFFDDSS